MPNGFPCPNPTCKHVFPSADVKGANSLTCPSCGTVYQFRKPAGNPKPPSTTAPKVPPPPPAAKAVRPAPPPPPRPARGGPPPLAPPVAPPVPAVAIAPPVAPPVVEEEFEEPASRPELAFSSGPDVLVSPRKRRPRRSGGWLKGVLVFLVLAGIVAGALYHFRDELSDILDSESAQRKATQTQGNFSFRVAGGWKPDEPLRDKMRANIAVTLKKPRGHMALFYLDHQARAFNDGRLLDRALRYLRGVFPQMEYEDPFSGEKKGRTGTLGGESAIVFNFSAADQSEVPMRGQAYLLSRQGYSYWLFFWAPEDNYEVLVDRWELLRQGFKLYNERDGWKPRPRPMETFTGSALGYQLSFANDFWKKEPNAKDADQAAELFLRAFESEEDEVTGRKRTEELAGKAADILVLVLPRATDLKAAAAATQEHLKKKQMELHPMLKLEPLPDTRTGKAASGRNVGAMPGQVDRLRLVLSPENERFVLLAVASRPEGVLAVVCECRWERKDYWEQEFRAIVESVRPAGKRGSPAPPAEKPPSNPPSTKTDDS